MKNLYKIISILMIAVLLIMNMQIISKAQTAVVIVEGLNLRKEPNTDSTILDQLAEKDKVEILESNLGNSKNWYKVKYKDITGYVYGEYIKVDGSSTSTTNTSVNENTNSITNTINNETTNNVVENNTIVENTITNNIEENIIETNTTVEPEITEQTEITEPVDTKLIEINTYMTVEEETTMYIIPLINAAKIHTVQPKEKLYIIQVLNGWAYVDGENTSGWVRCTDLV